MASMTAMLFLVLIGTLAMGFYTQVNIGTKSSHNEMNAWRARLAAESGMEFTKLHLAAVRVGHDPSSDIMFDELFDQLDDRLKSTPNMGAMAITMESDGIHIPGGQNFMELDDNGSQFRVVISKIGQDLRVRVIGRYGDVTASNRAIQMDYRRQEQPAAVFDYGMATRSRVLMDSNAKLLGSPTGSVAKMMIDNSTNPVLQMPGGATLITGAVHLSKTSSTFTKAATAQILGGVTKNVAPPEFPVVDTSEYKPFAKNVLSAVGATYDTTDLKNIYIKANTNPKFAGSIKVQGVIYIETPNNVTFDSNVAITGAIVVQNQPTGSTATNSIQFLSNVTLKGMDQLPATADFPPALRAMSGAQILAPKFNLIFDSNFGAAGGHIIGGKIRFNSNARGTVAGSILNMENSNVEMMGNTQITIARPIGNGGSGLHFTSSYRPDQGTYEEIR